MKLSMSMIATYLKKYDLQTFIQEDKPVIQGIRFFTDQLSSYSPEYCYIGYVENYIQDPRYQNSILLVSGKDQIICRNAVYEDLLNDILRAFEYYSHFDLQLHSAATEHQPLANILSIAETVIPQMIMVMNIDGVMLGATHPEKIPMVLNITENNEGMEHAHSIQEWNIDTISHTFVDAQGNISHDLADYPQLLSVQGSPDKRCVNMYLVQGDERIGFILIFPENELEEYYDLALAGLLGAYCSEAAEFTALSSVNRSTHSIMLQLLQTAEVRPAIVDKLQKRLANTSYPVLAAYQSNTVQNYTYRRMLSTQLENSDLPCLCCEYEDMVYILTDQEHLTRVLQYIQERIHAQTYTISISMPLADLSLLSTAREQCQFTLRHTKQSGICYCKDYALPYLLQNLREQKSNMTLIHPAVPILQQYDKENDGIFIETLVQYLKSGCNQAETATRLHVHLNTLKYRLRRITELTHVDFKDREEAFYVELSLRLCNLM